MIPNFIDCERHQRQALPDLRASLAPRGEKLVTHVSNFRPVKRVDVAVESSPGAAPGPVTPAAGRRRPRSREGPAAREALGIAEDVVVLGEQDPVIPLLSVSDVFLLPSAQESFGLAALEAMACGVPVVASRVGGLSEVVEDGVSGCLHAPDDIDGMARSVVTLLTDEPLHARMAAAATLTAHDRYCDTTIVPIYESYYEKIMSRGPAGRSIPRSRP